MPKPGSRGAGSALPIINRPTPGQSERGVGGVPVQGQLFPPIRANTAPVILEKAPKRRLKDGKLSISNPVIRQSSGLKIRDTIPTVDLATAARNDQERRANGISKRNSGFRSPMPLASNRVTMIATIPEVVSEGSYLSPNASTTAAQISPGADELRRRSPRSGLDTPAKVLTPPARSPRRSPANTQNMVAQGAPPLPPQHPLRKLQAGKSVLRDNSGVFVDSGMPPEIPTPLRQGNASWTDSSVAGSPLVPRVKPLPMPFPQNTRDSSSSAALESHPLPNTRTSVLSRSANGSVRKDIRPSRQRPASPTEEEAPPAKTPVQLRAVNGIPLNPRAQQARTASSESGKRGQTIMFVNQAHGNLPVEADSREIPVSRQISALALASSAPSASIVHRPRPIPRKSSIYKADITIKASPIYRHRLSRIGGSVELERESITSGSEPISRIPSFPEPPRSASAVLSISRFKTISDDAESQSSPGSDHAASEAEAPFSADGAPFYAAGTDPKTAMSESTEFGGRTSLESELAYQKNAKRQSSPVLPVEELRHVSMASMVPRPLNDKALAPLPSSARSGTSTASQNEDEDKELVPLVLDTHSQGQGSATSSKRSSSFQPAAWHRRVGDACPTFSDRKNGIKSPRRVLAPTPLLLSRPTKQATMAEAQASPLESPQHALDVIQEQLRRLDGADSEAGVEDKQRATLLDNLEAEMGAQETHWQDIRRNLAGRSPSSTRSSVSLLPSGDLNLTSPRPSPALRSHDLSLAVIGRGADPASGPENHTKTPADEKSAPPPSTLTRGRSKLVFTDSGSAQTVVGDVGDVENRAQFGKPVLQNKDGLLPAISNSISAHRQLANHLGSPTPPDTDESEDETQDEIDDDVKFDSAAVKDLNFGTWAQPVSIYLPSVEPAPLPVSHWSLDSDTTALVSETLQRTSEVLQNSSSLITNTVPEISVGIGNPPGFKSPYNKDEQSPGLLHADTTLSPTTPTPDLKQSPRRPVTQKPPRRSKRITLLPDIPESPKPLKNKRDTLGVFQFPWGEVSDIATLQPQRSTVFSVPLPETTLNELSSLQPFLASHGPIVPSQQYPVSFFDHYDDDPLETSAPDSDNSEYSDEEDEAFDETTLWEIANLLRTADVPSRESLFPASEENRPPSRAGFVSTDETLILAVRNLPDSALDESTLGTAEKALPSLPLFLGRPLPTTTWKSKKMFATVTKPAGLPQPDAKTWRRYLGEQGETLRPAPRKSEPATITSTALWTMPAKKETTAAEANVTGLWQPIKKVAITPSSSIASTPSLVPSSPAESSSSVLTASTTAATTQSHGLWTPRAPVVRVFLGLPQDEKEWSRYSSKKIQSSRPKPRPSVQDTIHSTSLWTCPNAAAPAQSAPVAAPAAAPAAAPSPLWSKPAPLPAERTEGLWSTSHIRHEYRKTTARPAAIDTVRKLRIDYSPLATLRSASLWSTTTQMPPRQVPDWLALSTTLRPVSPSGASTISDADYASAFDTYSLRSEVTAASSVATSKQSQHRKTTSKQAAQDELDAAFRDVMQTKPMPPVVAEEPEEKLFFDVTKAHPVFAVDVLHITSDSVHPAATGYLHSIINGAPRPRR